ncbi:hypothetical protein D0T12_22255 [Actinomadura spongiicola]|uniref:Uncharacterized protein n=1 Tax=Actinomadura spongiicola TaxID=2303421 RepID=A0A372GED7_9ACTN|nr:hypothetical protein [Actinomadura spongiicola]RFS83735.1 hypothetical protein D0T12_22255 [Actinomadura spongiicola]
MVARVRVLRPRPRPRPRFVVVPSSPSGSSVSSSSGSSWSGSVSSWDVWPVGVEWDDIRSLHVARCQRCAESFASPQAGEVDDWADTHRCDPELVALLALVTSGRAA